MSGGGAPCGGSPGFGGGAACATQTCRPISGSAHRGARPRAIDGERERLQVDVDRFDAAAASLRRRQQPLRIGSPAYSGSMVSARSPFLFALMTVPRSVEAVSGRREIVRRHDRLHAGHRKRLARVDPPDARMWQRAGQQLAEQHSFRVKVFGRISPSQ